MIHVLRLGLGNVRAVSTFAVVSISKFRLLLQTSSVHVATARLRMSSEVFRPLWQHSDTQYVHVVFKNPGTLRVNIPDHP